MKYIMKAGTLYFNDMVSARIEGALTGPKKKITSSDGSVLLYTDIADQEVPPGETRNVRYRQYILSDGNGNKYAVANPDYAEEDDPGVTGWSLYRIPRADHAKVVFEKEEYLLVMQNSRNYILSDESGKAVIQIFHRGLSGGWDIEVMNDFIPASNGPGDCLQSSGDCREGCCAPVAHGQHRPKRSVDRIPRSLGRCRFDAPLSAAGFLTPEMICGIFVFCRYIEQENEFST